jgi:hypothetical protein
MPITQKRWVEAALEDPLRALQVISYVTKYNMCQPHAQSSPKGPIHRAH